jgi:UDP:flavonoid glycosyltransferase YjiC (YdhE family)
MLRPAPGIPFKALKKVTDIGPIAGPVGSDRTALREAIGATPEEKIVLVGFGGIALDALPLEQMDRLAGYRFIVSGPVPRQCARVRAASTLPFSFQTLLASADVIVTKPGYSTVVEAVALGKPVVYVRRFNFADEQALVDYLHRYGCAVELPEQDFSEGRWEHALETVSSAPPPSEAPPPPTGALDAARVLSRQLARS